MKRITSIVFMMVGCVTAWASYDSTIELETWGETEIQGKSIAIKLENNTMPDVEYQQYINDVASYLILHGAKYTEPQNAEYILTMAYNMADEKSLNSGVVEESVNMSFVVGAPIITGEIMTHQLNLRLQLYTNQDQPQLLWKAVAYSNSSFYSKRDALQRMLFSMNQYCGRPTHKTINDNSYIGTDNNWVYWLRHEWMLQENATAYPREQHTAYGARKSHLSLRAAVNANGQTMLLCERSRRMMKKKWLLEYDGKVVPMDKYYHGGAEQMTIITFPCIIPAGTKFSLYTKGRKLVIADIER